MIVQLYPQPASSRELEGTYLAHDLRGQRTEPGRCFVYGNFVTSIDGRIAVPHPSGRGQTVPKTTGNPRDWRLFQELAAQADLIISSGRYLREWAEGRAQEILQIDDPRFADLRAWRGAQGLAPQPDIALISGSLDFPIPEVLTAGGRRVVVFTTANPDPTRVRDIEAHAGRVFVAGDNGVDGAQLMKIVRELGYGIVYSAAGPKIMHLLLAGRVLDRLYLTYANRVLGGNPFSTIVEGPLLQPAVDLRIHSLYLDADAFDGLGQVFAAYDVMGKT